MATGREQETNYFLSFSGEDVATSNEERLQWERIKAEQLEVANKPIDTQEAAEIRREIGRIPPDELLKTYGSSQKDLEEWDQIMEGHIEIALSPVDEDEVRDFERRIQTLTAEEWFRKIY